jgi:hypothetical protein
MNRSWFGELNSPPQTYMKDLWMNAWCAQRGPGLQQQQQQQQQQGQQQQNSRESSSGISSSSNSSVTWKLAMPGW